MTGPSHVKLGLGFSSSNEVPVLVRRKAIGTCSHEALEETKILQAIMQGVKLANERFDRNLCVSEIIYFENDTSRYELYRYCAFLIAKEVIVLSH